MHRDLGHEREGVREGEPWERVAADAAPCDHIVHLISGPGFSYLRRLSVRQRRFRERIGRHPGVNAQPLDCLPSPPGSRRLRTVEQASWRRARHQRDHGEGTPRQGHAKDASGLARRFGKGGCATPTRARGDPKSYLHRPIDWRSDTRYDGRDPVHDPAVDGDYSVTPWCLRPAGRGGISQGETYGVDPDPTEACDGS